MDNNGILETLYGKRQAIVAAIFMTVLMVFVTVAAVAADKADQTKSGTAPAAAQTKPAVKQKVSTTPETGKDAAGSKAADDAAKTKDGADTGDEGDVPSAAEERRAPLTPEELIRLGWIPAQVKDKSELPPFKMIYIKGGCFEMGDWTGEGDEDERPAHTVCVSNYYLSETEVTQNLWLAVMGNAPSIYLGPEKPVTNVTPRRLRQFIKRLNKLTGGFYRLPTEAEWEYAARDGGKKMRWAGSDNEEDLPDYAWFADNSDGVPQDVKKKKPNGLGLYDMSGNVWEYMEDFFDFDYYERSSKRDPLNMIYTTWFSMRGGSMMDNPNVLRTTYRLGIEPMRAASVANLGIRLAQ
ncbi:MAG: SUMF1/EgtB/PvdO family nonheme iron enzyme [Deltaproteobacteria bacterium]|nr:SUMF1/EgtB/PvdO family nonheme iron enzyme [Deltaproteobacteria bacterium]